MVLEKKRTLVLIILLVLLNVVGYAFFSESMRKSKRLKPMSFTIRSR